MTRSADRPTEARIDQLRDQARRTGRVEAAGVRAAGGPMPFAGTGAGYYGLPVLKPPVWKWMIPVYFFTGGLAGMSALIAAAALLRQDLPMARAAMGVAAVGAVVSPILLIWDLGRPRLFFNMLRVFKPQSPMSVGSWLLFAFGAAAIPGAVLVEWSVRQLAAGHVPPAIHALAVAAVVFAAAFGALLACYTGALVAATAIPAWHLHRVMLPFTFGVAGLGSAAGMLELLGFRTPPLAAIGYAAAGAELLVMLSLEVRRHGAIDRALRHGGAGWTLRTGELLEGPWALLLRAVGLPAAAAAVFLAGALVSRFGWVAAGRRSAEDPEAVFAEQGQRSHQPA